MPIHEYICRQCGRRFEFLLLPARKTTATCPECQSQDLERQLSGFSVSSPELSRVHVKKARTAALQSKDYKDKKIAEAEEVREHMHDH